MSYSVCASATGSSARLVCSQTYEKDSLLEKSSPSTLLMNVTRKVLLQVFAYHQVPPCYLNFIACSDTDTSTRDLRFGGFRAETSFRRQGIQSIPKFGRSG